MIFKEKRLNIQDICRNADYFITKKAENEIHGSRKISVVKQTSGNSLFIDDEAFHVTVCRTCAKEDI